jgi:hypothetical protein
MLLQLKSSSKDVHGQEVIVNGGKPVTTSRGRIHWETATRNFPAVMQNFEKHSNRNSLHLTAENMCLKADIVDRIGKEAFQNGIETGRLMPVAKVTAVNPFGHLTLTPIPEIGELTQKKVEDYFFKLIEEKGNQWIKKLNEIEEIEQQAARDRQAQRDLARNI